MPISSQSLKLSLQRALLGNVSPKLRAVCTHTYGVLVQAIFYYDGEISEDEKELVESVIDQIISDFHIDESGNDMTFNFPIIRLDYPEKPALEGEWVYYRYENLPGA